MAKAALEQIYATLGEEGLRKARWQEKMRVWNQVAQLVWTALYALLWIPTGWAAALRDALGGNGAWPALLFVLVFMLLMIPFNLPLAWFFDYRVENLLGTNRQSLGGWLLDQFKQGIIGALLLGLFFWAVYL
ncbi:MAG TPA: hypothetical protein ENJ85_00145, partial [Oceanithermus profundus]|nr:hypothetical protein [Oceanithermus profundus]